MNGIAPDPGYNHSEKPEESAVPSSPDLGNSEFSFEQSRSERKISDKKLLQNAELFTDLPDPKPLLDSFREVTGNRPDLLQLYIQDRNRNTADMLIEPGLSPYLSHWLKKGIGNWSPIRKEYKESWKIYFDQVQEDLPDIGRRAQRKITESLLHAGMLKSFEKNYSDSSENSEQTRKAFAKTLRRSKGISLRDRFVVYPIAATLMAAAGAGVAFRMQDNGLLPDPIRYFSRTEDEMLSDAVDRLQDMGHNSTAEWIKHVDLDELQREALANLGITGEEAEQFIRDDALNHLGFFESKLARITNGDGLFFEGTTIGSYDRGMDAIQLEPSMPRPDTLRHELTHRMGEFKEAGFLERVRYDGPNVEIDEGVCNIGARGLKGARDYNNALNVSLLAMLIGQREPILSAEQAQESFQRGIPYIARAFLEDNSMKSLEQMIDLRYGDGTYQQVIRDPYSSGNGGSRMNASLLYTLEQSGADVVSTLEAFEKSFTPTNQSSFIRSEQLVLTTHAILERTFIDTEVDGPLSAEFTASVADTYPDSDVSDLFRLYSVFHSGSSSAEGASENAYQQLKLISERDSGSPWWAEGTTLYARRAFHRGDMSASDALTLLEKALELYPTGFMSSKIRSAAQGILISVRNGHSLEVQADKGCPFSELSADSVFLEGWKKIHEAKKNESNQGTDDSSPNESPASEQRE